MHWSQQPLKAKLKQQEPFLTVGIRALCPFHFSISYLHLGTEDIPSGLKREAGWNWIPALHLHPWRCSGLSYNKPWLDFTLSCFEQKFGLEIRTEVTNTPVTAQEWEETFMEIAHTMCNPPRHEPVRTPSFFFPFFSIFHQCLKHMEPKWRQKFQHWQSKHCPLCPGPHCGGRIRPIHSPSFKWGNSGQGAHFHLSPWVALHLLQAEPIFWK